MLDRISEIYMFDEFDFQDVKQIVTELSEVEIHDSAIRVIHQKATKFRQIVQIIDKLEKVALANTLITIDKITAEDILNA